MRPRGLNRGFKTNKKCDKIMKETVEIEILLWNEEKDGNIFSSFLSKTLWHQMLPVYEANIRGFRLTSLGM